MELKIREAHESDGLLLSALAAATFYEAYVETDDPHDLAEYVAASFSPEVVSKELADPSGQFFIAEADGKAVGYAKLRVGQAPDFLAGVEAIEVQRIYLLGKFGRKGIGSALIEECIRKAEADGYEVLFLGVWKENLSAKAFYAAKGFRPAGEVGFTYGKSTFTNEVMVKQLRVVER